jgi:hydroxyacid-oxoacid transhydrogenase
VGRMFAATMAGVGFDSAGVHNRHACAYPIAGLSSTNGPRLGYPGDHPFVPHGHSVIVMAPAAFRSTYPLDPERHHRAAELLAGAPHSPSGPQALPDALLRLIRDVGAPRGLAELGYAEEDIPALVEGAQRPQRLLALAPREPDAHDLALLFRDSMANW